ncbi:hypothetical protein N0V83_002412 [Neocucurbitaria cava]|uniref:Cupin type-1 domain-containing protein n=1 Tax=Neocucurbitaria cava TaxID=798079 RepID=A0A9W8YF99_9PLEO|nr:hypothetical protein N0V83_002412 [Neocucurbitaria cava]
MFTLTKVLVAGLATLGAVQALPAPQAASNSTMTPAQPSSTPAPSSAPAANNDQAALYRDLSAAPTAIDRLKRMLTVGGNLLTGDALKKAIVFDFNGATPAAGAKGGATKAADVSTFPLLYDFDISTTLGFLNPCGINTPHVHPRATEFLTLVSGSNLRFGMVLENGLVAPSANPEVASVLNKFEGTVFPQGSIHYQFNDNCEPATFVAALDSNNPGTNTVAQGFFALNSQVVGATLALPKTIDGKNFEEFRKMIPANLAQDVDTCLARCKKQ